jgi:RimJ/RimL family protein N-acetyltransferase
VSPVEHPPPPYLIRTERLTIRCWDPRDAPLLKDALDTSLDHLVPWMPWAAAEPKPVEEKADLLRLFRGRFDLGEDFVYGIFTLDEREVIGGSGLHTRVGPGALEIGYWIRASRLGRGFAREAAAALTTVAIRVCGVDRVEIHVDPANEASLRIPRALGFTQEATLRRRLPAMDGGVSRDAVVFTLFADELDGSPVADARPRHSTCSAAASLSD